MSTSITCLNGYQCKGGSWFQSDINQLIHFQSVLSLCDRGCYNCTAWFGVAHLNLVGINNLNNSAEYNPVSTCCPLGN